ncbi:MAG: hypothetical protein AB1761_04885 [Pseudomonadota bacterium]
MKHDWKPAIFAGLVLLGLAACGGGGAGGAPPAGTLQLSTSSSAIALTRGGSTSLPVTLTPDAGFSGTVSFVLEKADGSAAPAGLSVTPRDATVSGTTTVTLTVASSAATPTGPHTLRIRASGGSLASACGSHCTDFNLYVAARGDLDPAFGNGGKVLTAIGGSEDFAFALALAPDGKIVVAGTSYNGTNDDFALARYNADGSLDTTFGSGGKVVTAIGGSDEAYALALAPGGKIVVAGTAWSITGRYVALARYNADGTLDSTFGSGGKVVTAIGIGSANAAAHAVALAPDGRIVVAGFSHNGTNYDFALARYNTDGTLDASFGSGGKVLTAIGSGNDYAYALALAPDGKIVVAGTSHNGTSHDFALARYNADGTLDASFGSGGRVTTPIGPNDDEAYTLALAPDGKIVVAGKSHDGMKFDFALARYNVNGTLDATFGNGGKVVTAFGSGTETEEAIALALAPDGKIVVAGTGFNGTNYDFALARYNADGTLEATFGNGGKVTVGIGTGVSLAHAMALAPDGRIVVAGRSHDGTNYDFALARYH